MRYIMLILVALAAFTPWASAADPNFDEDFVAIMESDDLRSLPSIHPTELKNDPSALAARKRVLEDAANRVAARLNVDVTQLLQMPLEQQIRDADDQDSIKAVMLALALGHAGQDEATRAGLRLLLSRPDNPFSFTGGLAVLLLAPAGSDEVWNETISILNEGTSNSIGLMWLGIFSPPGEESIRRIETTLKPDLVDPLSLLQLAGTIENPIVSSPGQPMRPLYDEPQPIPEPILARIRSEWRAVPVFAGWVATRADIAQETSDEALHTFLQWGFVFGEEGAFSGERMFALSSIHDLLRQDHTRQIIEDAVAEERCSKSMARLVMEQLEAEKASKIWMEQNQDLVPVRDERDG